MISGHWLYGLYVLELLIINTELGRADCWR